MTINNFRKEEQKMVKRNMDSNEDRPEAGTSSGYAVDSQIGHCEHEESSNKCSGLRLRDIDAKHSPKPTWKDGGRIEDLGPTQTRIGIYTSLLVHDII